jgi:UDP-N-acetylglucosamine/UDP-N-acetylgalactosamine diphosphorylase
VAAQRERYARAGQGQVFAFAGSLPRAELEALARQAAGFDPAAVGAAFVAARARAARPERLEAPDVLRLPERGGDAGARERARARGEALLAEGSVGVLVVAGGQGTRLGFPGPKGAFPLGPVSGRTLFGQQAQKLHAARRRSGRALPWLVMTSDATDAATRALFESEGWFGLPPEDVRFFAQGVLPNVGLDGLILLEAPGRIATSPDGHGGVLPALAASGTLDWLEARGVRRLSYSQVDNPLAPLADPVFLGLHELAGAEMSAKVLAKRTPEERAGTVGCRGGRVHVLEYTEVDPWHRDQRGPDGELVYWAGSIALHVLNVDFARRVAADAERLLPCHASPKVIPTVDPAGRPLVPDAPNGYKLERFVFDALPQARRVALLEVRRTEEYSPIKNRTGGESPRTAREDLVACYHRWLAEAGVQGVPGDAWIELDQSRVDGPEDLRAAGIRRVGPETGWIRLGSREAT